MKMKLTRNALALSAAALLILSGPALAQIKIGFHAPLTGPTAADGKSSEIGAKMAVDWINAAGGVLGQKLELVVYDDQGKADQSIPLANKMIGQDKVSVVISGGYSLPTRAASPVFQKAGVPYFAAYAVHPDITTGGNFAFRGVTLGPPFLNLGYEVIYDAKEKRLEAVTLRATFPVLFLPVLFYNQFTEQNEEEKEVGD